jgi:hypothetical protein
MIWFILAHIVPHLIFGIIFVIISAITMPPSEGWDLLAEVALDFAILGLGATGAVFDNSKVGDYFGVNAATLAISIVAVSLLLAVIIVAVRTALVRRNQHFSLLNGIIVVFLGVLTLAMPSVTLFWAYLHGRA